MIRQLYKIACILILFVSTFPAQTIDDIQINILDQSIELDGNEYIVKYLNLNFSLSLLEKIEFSVANWLNSIGYVNHEISNKKVKYSSDSSRVVVVLNLNPMQPLYLNKIFINADDSTDVEILYNKIAFIEGVQFSKTQFENSINEYLKELENNGYPFAKVIVSSLLLNNSDQQKLNAEMNLKIEKGSKSKIHEIIINGNNLTRDYVFYRNIGIYPGDDYSQNKIDEIQRKLNKLRYFSNVEPPVFSINQKDEGILTISVKETETFFIDGIIGYTPKTDNRKGYFTGFANLDFRNLFGTERELHVKWQKEDPTSQNLFLAIKEPWVFDIPINVEFSYSQRKQDSTYIQNNLQARLEYLFSSDFFISALLSSNSVIPLENSLDRFSVFNSNSMQFGFQLTFDSRDNVYAPKSGILFNNVYQYSSKNISGPLKYLSSGLEEKIQIQKFEVDITGFYEFALKHISTLSIHAKEIKGSLIDISDLYRFGGTNSLRGFRENQFMGNRIFWSNLEYRYLLTPKSFAFLFFDSGYFFRKIDTDIEKIEEFKYGYGFGISLETTIGLVKISYALSEGSSISNGLIHFGLLNTF